MQEVENTNIDHSRFVAEAPARAKWKETEEGGRGIDAAGEDFESVTEGKGRLSPTSSHLFKLVLPLGHLRPPDAADATLKPPPPTAFLLHPSQPLSHVSRLILAQLAPATPSISFQSTTPSGRTLQWANSTDVGDFIRDAARATEFALCIGEGSTGADTGQEALRGTIHIEVPSFADRTRFLRRRLAVVEDELREMEALKRECDHAAHRGAHRMAIGGLAMLVVYWGAVARLTFWDLGWDVMEPVTYLSGLTMVIMGYLWFLYQGREVSYASVLQHSVSARRDALYKARGLDVERWLDLVGERKAHRREIARIAEDYDERVWKARQEERDERQKDVTRGEERAADAEGRDDVEGPTPVPDSEEPAESERKEEGASIDEPTMESPETHRDEDEDNTKAKKE
ncbi:hypothetical protein FOMPIDRAFT_1048324 [Fomitopsis schrenkii]|uniref:Calcium uniporter protein, mitochondrial n=1 Tax=Fomitopsis schrenkii TaxID=2126942 RepID=S8FKZ6_FOMSC|nr:hypothetical protein FOMPIDRAFT_1048324 [Fomitopsis schrenkii]